MLIAMVVSIVLLLYVPNRSCAKSKGEGMY